MHSNTKILNKRDKVLFEKALKFYFFSRQQNLKSLNKELADRIHYSGSVAYSLITTYIRTGSLKIEYMDYLNQELKQLVSLKKNFFVINIFFSTFINSELSISATGEKIFSPFFNKPIGSSPQYN